MSEDLGVTTAPSEALSASPEGSTLAEGQEVSSGDKWVKPSLPDEPEEPPEQVILLYVLTATGGAWNYHYTTVLGVHATLAETVRHAAAQAGVEGVVIAQWEFKPGAENGVGHEWSSKIMVQEDKQKSIHDSHTYAIHCHQLLG